jgi:hypothetical protein
MNVKCSVFVTIRNRDVLYVRMGGLEVIVRSSGLRPLKVGRRCRTSRFGGVVREVCVKIGMITHLLSHVLRLTLDVSAGLLGKTLINYNLRKYSRWRNVLGTSEVPGTLTGTLHAAGPTGGGSSFFPFFASQKNFRLLLCAIFLTRSAMGTSLLSHCVVVLIWRIALCFR